MTNFAKLRVRTTDRLVVTARCPTFGIWLRLCRIGVEFGRLHVGVGQPVNDLRLLRRHRRLAARARGRDLLAAGSARRHCAFAFTSSNRPRSSWRSSLDTPHSPSTRRLASLVPRVWTTSCWHTSHRLTITTATTTSVFDAHCTSAPTWAPATHRRNAGRVDGGADVPLYQPTALTEKQHNERTALEVVAREVGKGHQWRISTLGSTPSHASGRSTGRSRRWATTARTT